MKFEANKVDDTTTIEYSEQTGFKDVLITEKVEDETYTKITFLYDDENEEHPVIKDNNFVILFQKDETGIPVEKLGDGNYRVSNKANYILFQKFNKSSIILKRYVEDGLVTFNYVFMQNNREVLKLYKRIGEIVE